MIAEQTSTISEFKTNELRLEHPDIPKENIPVPVGYRVLVVPATVQEVSPGGIVLAAETIEVAEHLRYVACVLAMGPEAYKHPRFLDGKPWCEVGDWVVLRQYAGMPFEIKDETGKAVRVRLVNDDEILARVENPDALAL